ncbi:hypothetical protein QFC19_004548 [Naganishia cerealis]|uniref:Uncharacterized protein n=1 Tax=Naganishia cerealis TaxID=610337 RepID=A0ACC2VW31_9TREE|nr:hypothetical protein QFC19_004548 [Naganishia cerealis]
MGRGKIKKIKPVSLQARKAAIAQQQQLQAQKAALERQIAEERSKQARLQREIEEKERLVRGLERVGAQAEEAYSYSAPWNSRDPNHQQQQQQRRRQEHHTTQHVDSLVPISDKALSMLNHMLGNRGLMQRDPATGTIDVVLGQETLASSSSAAAAAGEGEANAETREALAEAMAAMKAAAHVAKALPLMMLKSAAESMAQHGGNGGQWTSASPSQQAFNNNDDDDGDDDDDVDTVEPHMFLDPRMMEEHLHEFRAMLEDPEERVRLGVGFEMLGWAVGGGGGEHHTAVGSDGQVPGETLYLADKDDGRMAKPRNGHKGNGARTAHDLDPVPTLEDMLNLPIFNNEAAPDLPFSSVGVSFRSSPLFGKSISSNDAHAHAHHSQATSGELFLDSTGGAGTGTKPMDLHNFDLMQDFLSSAPGMLNRPLFGGGGGGARGKGKEDGSSSSSSSIEVSIDLRGQAYGAPSARHPPAATDRGGVGGGEMTASEAVKAVTELLEASSRKLQKVTGEHGHGQGGKMDGEAGHLARMMGAKVGDVVDGRVDSGQQQQCGTIPLHHAQSSAHPPRTVVPSSADISDIPLAAANAILEARAIFSRAAAAVLDDADQSDTDAISVEGDPNAFDDEDEAYYSDEDYEEEEYYEDGERIAYTTDDGEVSSRYMSSDGREAGGYYDSEEDDGEGEDDEDYAKEEQGGDHAQRPRQISGIPQHSVHATQVQTNTTNEHTSPGDQPVPSSTPTTRSQATPSTTHLPATHQQQQQHNPVSGAQMLEILKRMTPEERHDYQAALIREHQMEYERTQREIEEQSQSPPHPQVRSQQQQQQQQIQTQLAQSTARSTSSIQQKTPSVLDDPAIMASPPLTRFIPRK